MQYLRLFFIFQLTLLLILLANFSFGQKISKFDSHNNFIHNTSYGVLRISAGGNAQFFDTPFFKLQSQKYSDFKFFTNYPVSLASEIIFPKTIFPKTIFPKTHLIAGIYYAQTDMGYFLKSYNSASPGNVSTGFAASFTMDGTLSFLGIGLGLYHEIPLHKRFYLGISSVLNLGTFRMDKYLTDTATLNSEERKEPFFGDVTIITMPPKTYSFLNVRLKNEANLSYYISKSVAFNFGFIYNIGLPNKAFESSFYLYNTNDMSKPISYNKAVFSNSSMEFMFGMNISL